MEKEVDKKLHKPDPKRTGNSVTGKPLDKININPQLVVKEQQEVAEVLSIIEELKELMHIDLEEEGLSLDEALDIQQRMQRSRIMKRYARKIQRAKEISKRRIADQPHLRRRAFVKAREAVRTRLAGQVGADYHQLGPSEKIRIDKMLDKKTVMIKKIAQRLLPRVRTAEMKRLQSYIQGKKLVNAGQGEGRTVTESLNKLGLNTPGDIHEAIKGVLENTYDPRLVAVKKNFSMNKLVEALDSMIDDKIEITEQCMYALQEKATKSGIKLSTLTEVFARGYKSNSKPHLLPEQVGFARVNSFINKGKTYYTEDKDLIKPIYEMRKIGGKWQKVIVEEVRAPEPVKSKIDELFEARAPDTPYVKPHIEKGSTKPSGWKASDKWGKVKYFGTDFKKSAEKHAFKEEAEDILEAKATMCGRCGTKHVPASKGGNCPAMKEEATNIHPIVKEYNALKKHDIKTLRGMISQSGGVVDTSGFKSKDHAASHIIRSKHGNKKVDQAFGFNEDTAKEVTHTNENFMDGKGPGKPGDAARHGLKGKSAAELKKIRSSETASPRKKQLAHFMLNMTKEEIELDEAGLWDNIHAKRKRIKAGSGERMRKPGSEGSPTKQNFRDAQEAFVNEEERPDPKPKVEGTNCRNCVYWRKDLEKPVTKEELNKNGGLKAPNDEYVAMCKRIDLGTLPGEDHNVKVKGFCDHSVIKDWVTERMCCSQWDSDGMIRDYKGHSPVMKEEETKATKARKKLEIVDRKPPHTEFTKQSEIQKKIIDEEGNVQPDPKKRLVGTKSLLKAYKKDTPGQCDCNESLNESFNIAFASGVGITLTAKDLGMVTKSGFALHPSVIEQMEEMVDEEVTSADKEPVVIPAHKDAHGNTIPAKTVKRKKNKVIIKSGNVHDGEGA